MASDWIPIRVDLLDDPAVIAIAGELGLDEFAIAGRLLKLWAWCNKQLSNGDAAGVTELWIDRYVNATGFAAAMIRAGWLEKQPSGIEFPKFDRWNSKGAKRRVLTARRMRSHRVPGDANRDANRDAPSVTDASTREEKRREEGKPADLIHGCSTTGRDWKFCRLAGTVLTIDDVDYVVPLQIEEIAGILLSTVHSAGVAQT